MITTITTLLDADIQEMEDAYRAVAWAQQHRFLDKLVQGYYHAKYWFLQNVVCRIKGHDLVDNGYATPDSGCIDMSCKRCGYSWPTQWLY